MNIEKRILKFVTITNWILFSLAGIIGSIVTPPPFARGVIFGGLIVTINFHLLAKTLKKALSPPHISPFKVVIAKYYIRFTISGFIIFVLIAWRLVDPLGLLIGLSVVVASITLATMRELKTLIFKEAV